MPLPRSGRRRGQNKEGWYWSFIAEVLGPDITAKLIREAHSVPLEVLKKIPAPVRQSRASMRKTSGEEGVTSPNLQAKAASAAASE